MKASEKICEILIFNFSFLCSVEKPTCSTFARNFMAKLKINKSCVNVNLMQNNVMNFTQSRFTVQLFHAVGELEISR